MSSRAVVWKSTQYCLYTHSYERWKNLIRLSSMLRILMLLCYHVSLGYDGVLGRCNYIWYFCLGFVSWIKCLNVIIQPTIHQERQFFLLGNEQKRDLFDCKRSCLEERLKCDIPFHVGTDAYAVTGFMDYIKVSICCIMHKK